MTVGKSNTRPFGVHPISPDAGIEVSHILFCETKVIVVDIAIDIGQHIDRVPRVECVGVANDDTGNITGLDGRVHGILKIAVATLI